MSLLKVEHTAEGGYSIMLDGAPLTARLSSLDILMNPDRVRACMELALPTVNFEGEVNTVFMLPQHLSVDVLEKIKAAVDARYEEALEQISLVQKASQVPNGLTRTGGPDASFDMGGERL